MSDTNKFEEMLERLVNEDRAGAEELFHEIVVEKSRDIYEQLLSEEADEEVDETTDEEVDEATDEEVDESDEDLDEATDEEVDESDEDLDEATDEEVDESDEDLDEFMEPALEADPTDDMMGDLAAMGDDEPGDEEGDSEGGAEAALDDLEAALDALKDEFAAMMGDGGDDDGAEEPEMDMDAGDDEEGEEEAMAFEADDEVEEASDDVEKSPTEQMREYVEKIGGDQYQAYGKMGDNGANTKSPVAGKNDMGGTVSNMTQAKDNEAGAHDGLGDMNSKEENAGNVNVPGGKAAKAGKSEPGHGAEKKATGDNGQNKKSTIGS
jgi:hypothetical protein